MAAGEPMDATAVAGRLGKALGVAAASAQLRQRDHLALLDAIVMTAVRVIDAAGGSLMLLDAQANELVFQVAIGPGSAAIKAVRVPVGQGIAGFTAATGQALAIADTSQDPRFARQIAESSGYVPKSLLCVPLLLRGALIGVMELLDKRMGTAPFTQQDTAVLASFGDMAALAIDLSLQAQSLERLLVGAAQGENDAQVGADATHLVAAAVADPTHERTMKLAQQVAAIAGAGERQAELCSAILAAVAGYLEFGGGGGTSGAMDEVSSGGFFGFPSGGATR